MFSLRSDLADQLGYEFLPGKGDDIYVEKNGQGEVLYLC